MNSNLLNLINDIACNLLPQLYCLDSIFIFTVLTTHNNKVLICISETYRYQHASFRGKCTKMYF